MVVPHRCRAPFAQPRTGAPAHPRTPAPPHPHTRTDLSAPCPVLGFTILIELHASVADARGDALRSALGELLASNGLTMTGGGRRRARFEVRREGSQATEADRRLVAAWAEEQSDVARVDVSELVDLNPAS